jgi:hypothetical protein
MIHDPIIAAQHVERFFNDEVLQQVFRERKLRYFEQWYASNDPAERERIFAEARAFGALQSQLMEVVNAGLQEAVQQELERRSE